LFFQSEKFGERLNLPTFGSRFTEGACGFIQVVHYPSRSNHLRGGKEQIMIARHWRGWTEITNADAYETLLKEKVLPRLKNVDGYRGGYVFRSDGAQDAEFVVVNLFDSLDAVKRFAGSNYDVPVFEPEARNLLSKVEPLAHHYEVRACTV
jgi:heme-degrading monooxygenase HmoA